MRTSKTSPARITKRGSEERVPIKKQSSKRSQASATSRINPVAAMGVNHAYYLKIGIIALVGNKKNIIYIEASIDHSIPLGGWRGGDCEAVGGVGGA